MLAWIRLRHAAGNAFSGAESGVRTYYDGIAAARAFLETGRGADTTRDSDDAGATALVSRAVRLHFPHSRPPQRWDLAGRSDDLAVMPADDQEYRHLFRLAQPWAQTPAPTTPAASAANFMPGS